MRHETFFSLSDEIKMKMQLSKEIKFEEKLGGEGWVLVMDIVISSTKTCR